MAMAMNIHSVKKRSRKDSLVVRQGAPGRQSEFETWTAVWEDVMGLTYSKSE